MHDSLSNYTKAGRIRKEAGVCGESVNEPFCFARVRLQTREQIRIPQGRLLTAMQVPGRDLLLAPGIKAGWIIFLFPCYIAERPNTPERQVAKELILGTVNIRTDANLLTKPPAFRLSRKPRKSRRLKAIGATRIWVFDCVHFKQRRRDEY